MLLQSVGMRLPDSLIRIGRAVLCQRATPLEPLVISVKGKSGLELGGPSGAFQDAGIVPIYRYVASLDNCVFSRTTLWEGHRAEGRTFQYHARKPKGLNFIRDATDLHGISDNSYDFVLSAHNLEHIANPVRALKEWTRILKPAGGLILILPDFRQTFDHRRTPTSVAHMWEDYEGKIDETDLTHLPEILRLHDLSRDPGAGTFEEFRQRSLHNFENRCLHHHVFDSQNSRQLLESTGLRVRMVDNVRPHHVVLLAQKSAP